MFALILVLLFYQETIELNDKPLKDNSLKLTEIFSFNSGKDEVGSAIKIKVSSSGEIVAYNERTFSVTVFDKRGKEIRSFGEAGDGFGQLNYQAQFYLIHDHVLFKKDENLFVYDLNGIMTFNTTIEKKRSVIRQIPKGFRIDFFNQGNNPIDYIDFDMNGNKLAVQEFDYIVSSFPLMNLDYETHRDSYLYESKMSTDMQAYRDGRYMYYKKGAYQIHIVNPDFSMYKILKRKIKRIKPHPNYFKVTDWIDNVPVTKDHPERKKAYLEVYGEYFSDIVEINGQINGHIFVTRRYNKLGEYRVDIINPDFKVLSSITFDDIDLVSWDISANKIIMYFFDYDEGPFIKIYDVKFN